MQDLNNQIKKETAPPSQYDSALKQLMKILKTKSSDNLKQLEDLWDSINYSSLAPPVSSKQSSKSSIVRTSPTPSSSSQSAITSMSDNSNDSTSSTSSNLKRDFSKVGKQQIPVSVNRQVKKPRTEMPSKKLHKVKEQPKPETDCSMLDDFTCIVCKKFNQELNNKLIECRKCTNLYHQLCHVPRIRDDEIDEKDIEECATCKSSSEMISSDNDDTPLAQSVRVKSPTNVFTNLSSNTQVNDKKSAVSGVKGLASLANKFNAGNSSDSKLKSSAARSDTKPSANEPFKKSASRVASTLSSESKLKTNSGALNVQKKSGGGLFNLSNGNGMNSSSFTSSMGKEKKHLSGKSGLGKLEIQPNAPLITNSIVRSKIS